MIFKHDGEAEDYLKSKGFIFNNGYGYHPDKNRVDSPEDTQAIDYLFEEWDYCFGYGPFPEESK